jgi:hypothetical protein
VVSCISLRTIKRKKAPIDKEARLTAPMMIFMAF